MAQYRRLWKSLESAGVSIPQGARSEEIQIEGPEGVRFLGMAQVPATEIHRGHDVLTREHKSFLVGSVAGHVPTLDARVVEAWHREQPELTRLSALASVLCRDGVVLFRPFGWFDDRDVGVDVIIEASLLKDWDTVHG